MVAKITFPGRPLSALNYNEQKVEKGVAECVYAAQYLRPAETMNVEQKREVLDRRNALNERAVTNTLHVSLNFHPSERLSRDLLIRIARGYMERIGFGDQPYLVYQHRDAGHPHLHIVSIIIRADGTRIPTHNLGRNRSEKARQELEVEYELVRAQGSRSQQPEKSLPAQRAVYGAAETKESIAAIVSEVYHSWRVTTLTEFNAALQLYNVVADPGREGSWMEQHRGLVYRILDAQGKKIGVPLKASVLPGKPTLKNLEARFRQNSLLKDKYQEAFLSTLAVAFGAPLDTPIQIVHALREKGIQLQLQFDPEQPVPQTLLVDRERRCVWTGKDLERVYVAAPTKNNLDSQKEQDPSGEKRGCPENALLHQQGFQIQPLIIQKLNTLVHTLLDPQATTPTEAFSTLGLVMKRRKKQVKRASLP